MQELNISDFLLLNFFVFIEHLIIRRCILKHIFYFVILLAYSLVDRLKTVACFNYKVFQ